MLLRRRYTSEQGEPVLVLVGMPNVGKSSLVTATSTGTPEINMYPFTTRSLKMGHVITPGHRYQVRVRVRVRVRANLTLTLTLTLTPPFA